MANGLLKKWKEEYWIRIYEMAKSGLPNQTIAKSLGVTSITFRYWLKRKPELVKVLQRARNPTEEDTPKTFLDYVYKRLPDNLKELWDEINKVDKQRGPIDRIETLLLNHGQRVRQQLFVHALVACNFNASEACRKVNISKKTFENWCHTDPLFQDLIDEIHWHKKNFFEGALIKLVKEGDTSAVLFVNKAFNKDRGYNDKQEVDVKHSHLHAHAVVDLDSLAIPFETKKQLLDALRVKRETPALTEKIIEATPNEVQ